MPLKKNRKNERGYTVSRPTGDERDVRGLLKQLDQALPYLSWLRVMFALAVIAAITVFAATTLGSFKI